MAGSSWLRLFCDALDDQAERDLVTAHFRTPQRLRSRIEEIRAEQAILFTKGSLRHALLAALPPGQRQSQKRKSADDDNADRLGPEDLKACYACLRKTKIRGNFLPVPALLQQLLDAPSKILVRRAYVDLAKICDEKRKSSQRTGRKMCLTGTPGTGKTLFLVYYFWHLLQKDPEATIAMDIAERPKQVLLFSGNYFKVGESAADFDRRLTSRDAILLADAKVPFSCNAFQLETSSPLKSKVWTFHKRGGEERILPPWTLEELKAARTLHGVSEATLLRLYSLWGGVVRWTLALAKDKANGRHLQEAIDSATIASLKKAAKGEDTLQLSSRILHHIPNSDYLHDRYSLGSPHIACEVFKRLDTDQKAETILLLNGVFTRTGGLGLRGQFFETKVKLSLQGRQHSVRSVGEGARCGRIRFVGAGGIKTFLKLEDVRDLPKRALWAPVDQLRAADFLVQPNLLVQATVNKKHHSLHVDTLNELAEVLTDYKAGRDVYLIYAVPEELYRNTRLRIPLDTPTNLSNQIKLEILLIPYS